MPVLLRSSLRYLARHPWQSWLSVIGIALGTSVVVGVDLANHSARKAFQLSLERIAGKATHQIESAAGGIPESLYVHLRREQGLRPAAPVIEGPVRIAGRTFTLLGLDPLASGPFRQGGTQISANAIPALLSRPGTLLMGAADARDLGLETGASLRLDANGEQHPITVAGLLEGGDLAATEGLVVADISTAQELLGRLGTIDRIDLILGDGRAPELAAGLPAGLRLETAERRTSALAQMTRAFHANLTAMSLLAMLVGGFIIYNTMSFAVLRRRRLLGALRTLGVTRAQLFRLVLSEALVFAAAGGILGIVAGVVVGWGLVQLVTRTISDLYFALAVSELFVSPWTLTKGALLGLLVTLIAALGPATEAAASQPADVLRRNRLEHQGKRLLPWLTAGGIGLMLVGYASLLVPIRSLGYGFVALFLIVIGFSLCAPLMLRGLGGLLTLPLGRVAGPAGRLAARGITSSISRTGIAVAALTVAVSATVGVSIMIDSFRGSVARWLEDTLSSDLYVSAPSSASSQNYGTLPPGIGERILEITGVTQISKGRTVRIEAETGPVLLLALESSSRTHRGFRLAADKAEGLWRRFEDGELILISEPYAYHQGLGVGDELSLFTTGGWRELEIGGVFVDYGSDSGMLVLPRWLYAEWWKDPGLSSIGILLAPDTPVDRVLDRVRALTSGYDAAIRVRPNRKIREQSLAVFDRTFVITQVLRLLAVGVAFVGVLSGLMALQLERARDYAILRATGFTRGQLAALILLQTSIMGLAAGLLAIPLGWILGGLLIDVVNVRAFGWSMEMVVPGSALLLGLILAWGAALLAGVYPALKVAATDPAIALREEGS